MLESDKNTTGTLKTYVKRTSLPIGGGATRGNRDTVFLGAGNCLVPFYKEIGISAALMDQQLPFPVLPGTLGGCF
ncbi:hypothetical protein [Pedobacter nutrimenti]|jgi:hypothetical protein|uniref:Uncharacterized protein n=1 Tax=Pedobacter nutrimenti TaxID=1241337 RepID=A0A318UN36_9SPHI|nr:hypothetical protein [Pedobacter nutrimenti]PYF77171.1 hypothetical protein B0O44_101651 [Pedobacter nutrimenti]